MTRSTAPAPARPEALGSARPSSSSAWRAAAKEDLLLVAPSVLPFGIALGLTATVLGLPGAASVLGAGLTFAGSAQLTATSMLSNGAGALAVVGAALVVNSRLLLYGAGLQAQFRAQPLTFRLIGAHFVIDGTYLAAVARTDLDPDAFRRYWWRLGTGVLVVWPSGVALGVLLAPVLPPLPHLGFVGVALFLAMLLPKLTDRPAVASAATAGLVGAAVAHVLPSLGVLAGAAAGLLAGTTLRRRSS